MGHSKNINTFDSTYSKRYISRNSIKVEKILDAMEKCDSVLDIGCNEGYLIEGCLDKGITKVGFGIDLNRKVVSPHLLNNPSFHFLEYDIADFKFIRTYDIIIYNAVHHHVFGKYGREVAWRIWQDIVDHCNQTLFFETGMVSEVGDYYWKAEIQRYFNRDEEHFYALLNLIGPRLKSVQSIVELPIHGIVRNIYKINLWPKSKELDLKENPEQFYGESYSTSNDWEILSKYKRTIGSTKQKLIKFETIEKSKVHVFEETDFLILRNTRSGNYSFAKRILHNPYKQMREFMILNSISHHNVIKLECVHQEYGLIFPYLSEWKCLGEVNFQKINNKVVFLQDIEAFFKYAQDTKIDTGLLDISDTSKHIKSTYKRLIDLVDLHQNNFLVKISGRTIVEWVVIDMEYYSNDNEDRNISHLKKIQSSIMRRTLFGIL
jgi:hypothetical protein